MATSTTIPVTIDPEAADLIAALGMERPFREMIEHSKQTLANLKRIEVEYDYKFDEPDDPTIHLLLLLDPSTDRATLEFPIRRDLIAWFLKTYHGDVARHFLLDVLVDRP
jgi:hypothetical protein